MVWAMVAPLGCPRVHAFADEPLGKVPANGDHGDGAGRR